MSVDDTRNGSSAPSFIGALLRPDAFPHPADDIRLIETHISWVILAGAYAYKIKKPVDLGFLDFSTLHQRHFFCQEELRLNRRLAAALYLEVVTVTGPESAACIDGDGPLLDYAVKMRRFDPDDQFDRRLARNRLPEAALDQLAALLSDFHQRTERASRDSPWGDVEAVCAPMAENFSQIAPCLDDDEGLGRLEALRAWTQDMQQRLLPLIGERKEQGHVRECHGDLHLGNLLLSADTVQAFDCLEFNPALRWIDTASEVAFLVMDLDAHHRHDMAWRFLNRYLEHSGDFESIALLDFYLCYRALVRAKVAVIQAQQSGNDTAPLPAQMQRARDYIALAAHYCRPRQPALLLTHGLSGAGKSTLSRALAVCIDALHLRSDIERKRLFGLNPGARSGSAVAAGIYSSAAGERTYARLLQLAQEILAAGYSVIVDATFLQRARRRPFIELARKLGVPLCILDCQAPDAQLRKWIRTRAAHGEDASEADLQVLDYQQHTAEALSEEERRYALTVDTHHHIEIPELAAQVRACLHQAEA